MDSALKATFEKLKVIRKRKDLTIRPCGLLADTYTALDGSERPFRLRYYQIQMVVHLLAMYRFVVGDDTGLGKCQPYDSLILTDHGLLQMGGIEDWSEMEPDSFRPMSRPIHALVDGERLPIRRFYYGGVKPTVTATTRYGFRNTGSRVHPMLVLREGKHQWVEARNLNEGDYLCVERREMPFPETEPRLAPGPGAPAERMTPDLARFLGYYIGEGSLNSRDTIKVSQCPVANPEPHTDINRLFKLVFGREPNRPQIADLYLSDRRARRWLAANGLDYCLSSQRSVPPCILQATRESNQEFLRALFEGEGHVSKSLIEYSTASEELGRQVQIMLLRFGVVSNRSIKKVKSYPDNTYWRLTICGADARRFQEQIGFISSRKVAALETLLDRPRNTNHDVVPNVQWLFEQVRSDLLEATSKSGSNGNRVGSGLKQFGASLVNTLNNIRNYGRNPSYAFIEKVVGLLEDAAPEAESLASLRSLVETRYFYDPVVSLEEGKEEVFDIEVDDPRHCFVGNGLVNHNTIEIIAALCYLWEKDPNPKAVVLTTKSATIQWEREFKMFSRGVTVIRCVGTKKQREKAYKQWEESKGPTVLISGYRSVVRDIRRIQDWTGYYFIADEATAFKNSGTQVHQVCRHLAHPERALRAWGVTATLIKNHLVEGHGIYNIIVPGLFPQAKSRFIESFCITRLQQIKGGRMIPIVVGYRPRDILRFRLMIAPYYLGRPKHKVADELPTLQIKEIPCGMYPFQREKYNETLEGFLELGSGEEKEVDKLTSLIYLQEIVNHLALLEFIDTSSKKLDRLTELVSEGGELHGQKTIVFTRFRKMVDVALPHLEAKAKIKCVRITGSDGDKERAEAQRLFQDPDSGVDVIFITMAGGDAINLQAAKALIFFDTPWSAGDWLQILGRMIRIGSLHDRVYALHLVVTGSIDRRVLQVLHKKLKLVQAIIGERIKGDATAGDDLIIQAKGELTDIWDGVMEDAKALATR